MTSPDPLPSSSLAQPAAIARGRILVVDDDPMIRNLLRHALQTAGYQVVTAADGGEALRLFAEQEPAGTIIDLFMPEKEGLETIVELRRRSPTQPIIAMSGRFEPSQPHYLVLSRIFGANAALAKPFTMPCLLDTVQATMGRPAPAPAEDPCRS